MLENKVKAGRQSVETPTKGMPDPLLITVGKERAGP